MVSSEQQDSPRAQPQRARFKLKWYVVVMAAVGVAMLGGGLWWLARPSTMPAQTPAVSLLQGRLSGPGEQHHLYIYADRRVYEATFLGQGSPGGKWAWKKGRVPQAEFDALMRFLMDASGTLKDSYSNPIPELPPPSPNYKPPMTVPEIVYKIEIHYLRLDRGVSAVFFVPAPDPLPSPLGEVVDRINAMASYAR